MGYETDNGTVPNKYLVNETQGIVLSDNTFVSDVQLKELFSVWESNDQFFILNTCYGGGISYDLFEEGRMIMSSSAVDEEIYVSPFDRYSPFYDTFKDSWNWSLSVEENYLVLYELLEQKPVLYIDSLFSFEILTPSDYNIIYYDIIDVLWTDTIDPLGYNITYSVYYSTDSLTWIEVASDINITNYSWDVSDLDYDQYLIKVIAENTQGKQSESILDDCITIQDVPHELSILNVLSPNGGEIYYNGTGVITIQWSEVTDSWGYDVNYAVKYSDDNGITWNTIVTSLESNTYNWDISGMRGTEEYLIMVIAESEVDLSITDQSDSTFSIY